MTVYDIPNIEHCNIEVIGNSASPSGYRITTHEGWYIHLNDGVEDTANIWKGAVALSARYDYSQVEIRAEADLPEGAEICGDASNEEVM